MVVDDFFDRTTHVDIYGMSAEFFRQTHGIGKKPFVAADQLYYDLIWFVTNVGNAVALGIFARDGVDGNHFGNHGSRSHGRNQPAHGLVGNTGHGG